MQANGSPRPCERPLRVTIRPVEDDPHHRVFGLVAPREIVEILLAKLLTNMRHQRVRPLPVRKVVGHQAPN